MSGFKSGGLLLLLAVPLALYAAWQVNGVVRTDLVLSEPPADRGPPKEQLAAQRAAVSAWAGEVGKAAAVVQQYRAAAPEDASPDPDARAVSRAAAVRSADLNDLDLFLSELERPSFTGKMKALYLQWMDERKELKHAAEAVVAWLGRPPAIVSAADATGAMNAALDLINAYAVRSKFSDKSKAASWRVQARLLVAKALKERADAQYRAAVREKLPLESGSSAVKTAVDTQRVLKDLITALAADLRLADEEKAVLDPGTRAAAERAGAGADECAAREELLAAFARDDLFTNPNGAAAWLKRVASLYRRTKDEKARTLTREKVQEFCDAFIPAAARLDDAVRLRGEEVPRKEVTVKFEVTVRDKETGREKLETKRQPLSAALDGINEFNLEAKPPGLNVFVVFNGREDYPRDLKPTDLSRAAAVFNTARKTAADIATGPRWSAKSVEELKKKCEAQKDLVDQLQIPGGGTTGTGPKIWTRLSGLAAGMVGTADLFEDAP